jgi:hypothetical protein
VAPVFMPGATSRTVYFPRGEWRHLEQPGEIVSGPGFRTVSAPLERLPVYVRAGAVIPQYTQAPAHLKGPAPSDWVLAIYPQSIGGFPQSIGGFPQSTGGFPGQSDRHLVIHEDGFDFKIDYHAGDSGSYLQVGPAPIDLTVRLVGRKAESIQVNGAAARAKAADGSAEIKVDARQGAVLAIQG